MMTCSVSRSWETQSAVPERRSLPTREERERYAQQLRESYSSSRAQYGAHRAYGRSISFGKDSYLSPVTAPRKSADSGTSYTPGILKHTNSGGNSEHSAAAASGPVSILRHHSDTTADSSAAAAGSRRARHNTLTFGVSGEDLDRARSNIQKYTRRLSDDTRPAHAHDSSHSALSKKASSRYSLPDVFDSLSGSGSYYDSGRHPLDTVMVRPRLWQWDRISSVVQLTTITKENSEASSRSIHPHQPADTRLTQG